MARRSQPHSDPAALAEEISRLLQGFSEHSNEEDLRAKVRRLVPIFHQTRDLGSSLIPPPEATSGFTRVLAYFRRYPGTVIDNDELMVVSGIQDFPRRIRELRVEHGWWIYSGVTFQEMIADAAEEGQAYSSPGFDVNAIRPDQYVLMKADPDADAAERWQTINSIRREDWSVQDKCLAFLRKNVGKPVSGEDFKYLANDRSEWPRRVRELRTEEGWPIATQLSGRPDLAVGVYVLEEDRQAAVHDRHIPDAVRVEVLERDKFACTKCGWTREMLKQGDPRRLLELHHIKFHRHKGDNTADNLVTLCNVHHDELHAQKKE
ncbi:MAG: HNH endonuclease [Rhizobiales bacterium]|nr:HNH endonuclease [Hyphomicrobiales bacterium]